MNIEISNLGNEKQIMIFKLKEFQNNYNAEDIVRFRETLLMQKEDLFLKDQHIMDIKKQLQKLYDKHMNLSIKYDKMVKQQLIINFEIKQTKSEKELIQDIKYEVPKDLQFQRCIYKEMKNPDQDQVMKNLKLLKDFGNQIYQDDLKKTKGQIKYQMCVLAKPSFYLLLDEKLKKMDYKNIYEKKKYNWQLFVTLRGIMDSKYNEIMLNHLNNDPVINISKFPEFVYSWLASFSIDEQTREVGLLDHRDIRIDEVRIDFLFELCHEKFNRIWEIAIFKDFLSEKSHIDELYFFLTIRHQIFKGPQLSIQKSKYDYISYITMDRMESVVKKALNKYGIQQQEYVIEKIKEKAKKKGKVLMIDVYFLLSVLLEYYKNEKKIKCRIIKDLFLSYPNSSIDQQFSISFDNYMHFMNENFITLSEIEKLQIYRDCWNLGGGKVGPEIFITVLNERNLFIKHINLNKQFNFPAILNYDRNIDSDNQNYEVLQTLYESVFENMNYFQKLENYVEGLGNEQFLNAFQQNYKVILQKFQTNSQDLQDFNIFHIMNRFVNKILQIQNIQIMNQISIDNFDESEYASLMKGFINLIADQNAETNRTKKLNQIKNNLRLINFQNFSRDQINKFYAKLLGLMNKYKIKKKDKS